MTSQFFDMTLLPFLEVALFPLWRLVTGPSFMSISSLVLELWQFSFIRDWPEIRKSKIPNIWRLGQVEDTKFGTNISNKMLLNAAKCQGYSFYCFWVIKEKPTGGEVKLALAPSSRLGLRLKNHRKATGLDFTTPKVIKFASNFIDSHLYNIIIKDLEKSKYSEEPKTALVWPIFKKNERNRQCINY